ncbi:hypothetical protein RRF57_007198 [Xylaria bambusicola]|uniref:Heterokaryon incompatibility domain-containing protein n=1 Tax=Xylaria bambusicola TaxID=326684 RepID=A0AAN7UUR7_9PEZI
MAYSRRSSYCSFVNSGAGSPLISDRSNIKFDAELLQLRLNRLPHSPSDSLLFFDNTIGPTPPNFSYYSFEENSGGDKASIASYESEDVPETYEYQSLKPDQFRLLAIHKPDHSLGINAPIQCSLHAYSFHHRHPKYRALSYSWDCDQATSTKSTIRMFLKSHDTVEFEVKPNLYHALKQLRNPEKKVWLWVDALCINQKNKIANEKPEQIRRMPDIYSKAESVIVWLGEAQRGDSLVVNFVKSII